MIDSSGISLYQSWSKLTCPLSEGVLSGLYHFPLVTGDVLLMLEAPFQALIQCANVVGASGQVHAIINPAVVSKVELAFLKRWYRNIWFAETEGRPYDPHADLNEYNCRRSLLVHGSKDNQSLLHKFDNQSTILSTIFSYMGTFPRDAVTTVVTRLPPALKTVPLTTTTFARQFVEYFNGHVRPVTSFLACTQSSFWIMGCYQLDESFSADQCCESLIRLQSASCGSKALVKPKEQLSVGSLTVLISRFKKSWTTSIAPPPPIQTTLDDNDTIRSTLASLCQLDFGDTTSSIISLQPPSAIPVGSTLPAEADIREAAMNVVWSHSNKTIGGPFADTLRSLAEELLLQTATNSNPLPQMNSDAPLLSTLLQTPPGQGPSTTWSTQPSPPPQLPRFLLEDILS